MNFSEKLRDLRKKSGLSQKELADKLGVAQASINYWEKGQRTPSIDMVTLISNYFVVSVDYLLTGKDGERPKEATDNSINKILDRMDAIGYITRADSEGNIWIEYPDGTPLDMTAEELLSLIDETDSYLKFKLEELRKKK